MFWRTERDEEEGVDRGPGQDEDGAENPAARREPDAHQGDEGQSNRHPDEERKEETASHGAVPSLGLCRLWNLETVAGPAHGLKIARDFGVGLDLLADAADVDIDGARRDEAGVAPDGVEEVVAAEDAAGMTGEIVEQAELGGGGGDEFAVDAKLHGAGVDLDVFEPDERGERLAARNGAGQP